MSMRSQMTGNPFLESVPEQLDRGTFFRRIYGKPPFPPDTADITQQERHVCLSYLSGLYIPMDYLYTVYDILLRAIRTTYTTKTMLDTVRQMQALRDHGSAGFATQAQSGSLLGVPGIGKTSAVRRCLSLLPQCITHTEYKGKPFYKKQILYLFVECPADCSIKTLAYSMIAAVDRAIGSEYFRIAARQSRLSASALVTQVKIICLNHGIGLIVVDELQNVISTAEKNRQIKPLIKFLVELVNDTCTSLYFVGTSEADQLFSQQEHLKRRTRGLRLLPLKPDAAYRTFLEQVWQYQVTPGRMVLTDAAANRIYDHSGGIPSYILQIFQESQAQALTQGKYCMDEQDIKQAIELLSLSVPKRYAAGTSLSDFSIPVTEEQGLLDTDTAEEEVNRLYAKPRGRKAKARSADDLLELWKRTGRADAFCELLIDCGLAERMV